MVGAAVGLRAGDGVGGSGVGVLVTVGVAVGAGVGVGIGVGGGRGVAVAVGSGVGVGVGGLRKAEAAVQAAKTAVDRYRRSDAAAAARLLTGLIES